MLRRDRLRASARRCSNPPLRLVLSLVVRASLVVVAFLANACHADRFVQVDIPDDVAWVALLQHDGAGAPQSAVEVARAQHGEVVFGLGLPEHRVQLAGFRLDQLSTVADLLDRKSAARLSEGCEPSLPSPAWAALITGGAASSLDPTAIPRITVDQAQGRCPFPAVNAFAEVMCQNKTCTQSRQVEASGCAARITFPADCGPALRTAIDLDGSVCLEDAARREVCPASAARTCVIGEAECDGPKQDNYRVSFPSDDAPYLLAERQLLPEPESQHRPRSLGGLHNTDMGWASGLAIGGSTVWVATRQRESTSCSDLTEEHPTEALPLSTLFAVDADTMEIKLQRSDAPPCVGSLVADGDGFVATFAEQPPGLDATHATRRIGRFDGSLLLLVSRPLGSPIAATSDHLIGMVRVGDRWVVGVSDNAQATPTTRLVVYDSSLSLLKEIVLRELAWSGLETTGPHSLVVIGKKTSDGSVLRQDVDLDAPDLPPRTEHGFGFNMLTAEISQVIALNQGRKALALLTYNLPGLLFFRDRTSHLLVLSDMESFPTAVSPWSNGRLFVGAARLLDGGAGAETWGIVTYVVDPTEERPLQLGRSVPLARPRDSDIPFDSAADSQGRVFMLTAIFPRLLRFTPAD